MFRKSEGNPVLVRELSLIFVRVSRKVQKKKMLSRYSKGCHAWYFYIVVVPFIVYKYEPYRFA